MEITAIQKQGIWLASVKFNGLSGEGGASNEALAITYAKNDLIHKLEEVIYSLVEK